ncbi:MAG: lysine 2,3-aminomutase [Gemmatimonadota bacterium]|nr:lysine 2,3-aminomutase [Gemmatimonadota bacterium]
MTRFKNGHVPKFSIYDLRNLRKIPQIEALTEEQKFEMEVVAQVLPFRTNPYVVEELINWGDVPNDPNFLLTFPQKDMLIPEHFDAVAKLLKLGAGKKEMQRTVNRIRRDLNPQPAGQLQHNVPRLDEQKLEGMQHKYRETVLFFPSQGQTCHAYCSFCFRWPQFVGDENLKFASRETERLIDYIRDNPQVTDVLFTGGDPMVMKSRILCSYIDALLEADLPNLRTIRIGTKSLTYWPYKYLTDPDADEIIDLFGRVNNSGKHLAIMAHFNHPNELQTEALTQAVERIRSTGAQIRTQSPILRHINDDADAWATMWRKQVDLGMIPYYMFAVRDTGAQHYFGIPLMRAWEIFRDASQKVSGICRTVRGPSMSAHPGKIQVLGINEVRGEKIMTLTFLQGRNPDWIHRSFFARYNEDAIWLDELEPAFGEDKFFFEEELEQMCEGGISSGQIDLTELLMVEEVA